MFARLGKVIYWVAYAVALLMFGLAVLVWFTERQSGDLGVIGNLVLIGMTALVIGIGCRYVLASSSFERYDDLGNAPYWLTCLPTCS